LLITPYLWDVWVMISIHLVQSHVSCGGGPHIRDLPTQCMYPKFC
jgi:hypothetical protein